jgi:hypothetical protein
MANYLKYVRELLFSPETRVLAEQKRAAVESVNRLQLNNAATLRQMKETGLPQAETEQLARDLVVLRRIRGNNLRIPLARQAKEVGDWQTISKIARRHVEGSFFSSDFKTGRSNYDDDLGIRSQKFDLTHEVVDMTPDQYIDEASKLLHSTRENVLSTRPLDNDLVQTFLNKGNMDIPYLDYSREGFGQEGLNRAVAAKELGIEKIPVLRVRNRFPAGGAVEPWYKIGEDSYFVPYYKMNSKVVSKEDWARAILSRAYNDPNAVEYVIQNNLNDLVKTVDKAYRDSIGNPEYFDFPWGFTDDLEITYDFLPSEEKLNRFKSPFKGDFNALATQDNPALFDQDKRLVTEVDNMLDEVKHRGDVANQVAHGIIMKAQRNSSAKYNMSTKVDQIDEFFSDSNNYKDNVDKVIELLPEDRVLKARLQEAVIQDQGAFKQLVSDASQADLTMEDLSRVILNIYEDNNREFKYESGDFLKYVGRRR